MTTFSIANQHLQSIAWRNPQTLQLSSRMQLQQLTSTRNLVAHNALSLALYEVDGAYQIGGFHISGKRNKDTHLGFDELKERGSRLNELRNTT